MNGRKKARRCGGLLPALLVWASLAAAVSGTGCRSRERSGFLVKLTAAGADTVPEFVTLTWFAPGDATGSPYRFPSVGSLQAKNLELGSVFFEVDPAFPGERRVLAVGMARGATGDRRVSIGAARVPADGPRDVAVVMQASLPDADRDDVPDVIDLDCRAPGCANVDAAAQHDGSPGPGDADGAVVGGAVDAMRSALPLAAACTAAAECASGFCVDGLCCDTACTGECSSCDLPGAQGQCTAIAAGQDPDDECAALDPSTCSTDGTCDGAGVCRTHREGTKCAAASCSGTMYAPPRTCDGAGTCRPANVTSCGGYACASAEACRSRCDTNADCSAGNVCAAGACSGPKPLGGACAAGTECASGQCSQGVCCDKACTTACYACNVANSVGSCIPIPAGSDPLNQCSDSGATSCGTDGSCDGAGKCRSYAATTPCAMPTCSNSSFTAGRTCNGMGTCRTAVVVPCAPFACGGTQCRTACASDAECASNAVCVNQVCINKRPAGEACGAAKECQSSFCTAGICCSSACTDTCQACNLAGSVGTCKPVPAGQDPLSQCADAGATSCGLDGACDGAGACRRYPAGTVCGAGTCAQGAPTMRTCNSSNQCQAAASPTACGRFTCNAAGDACRTSCAADVECRPPLACGAGQCGGLRAEYFNGLAFETSVVVRTDARVDFTWAAEPAPGVDDEHFTVRWTGTITSAFSEMHQIGFASDDGARMWIDGEQVIDSWVGRGFFEDNVTVMLTAGRAHELRIEYFERTGDARVRLVWQSPSQPRQIVPASALAPAP